MDEYDLTPKLIKLKPTLPKSKKEVGRYVRLISDAIDKHFAKAKSHGWPIDIDFQKVRSFESVKEAQRILTLKHKGVIEYSFDYQTIYHPNIDLSKALIVHIFCKIIGSHFKCEN